MDYVEQLKREAGELRFVRVCGTCRHVERNRGSWQDWTCTLYGRSTWHVRQFQECNDFEDWEPQPPPPPFVPILVRLKRWLIG